jgi:hypothetical protein
MTKNDIIRTARDAGSIDSEDVIETMWRVFSSSEREACARVCEEKPKIQTTLDGRSIGEIVGERFAVKIRARGNV